MKRPTFWPAIALITATVVARPARAEVDFVKDIQPILEQSCLKCHGPDRPKAGLRLDTREETLKGSKGGAVVVLGKPEMSILFERVTLPDGDELRMPPDGNALSADQQKLLSDWIKEGMKWPEDVVMVVPEGLGPSSEPVDKGFPITDAEKAALAKLQSQPGVLAIRLAQNTNLLRVDFSLGDKKIPSESLALLKEMPNLVELGLGGTEITDADLAHLKPLTNLRRLQLQQTAITDDGLENIKDLVNLESLNLYGTAITDEGLIHLTELKKLRKLYLWQTKVNKDFADELIVLIPDLDVNMGYDPPEAEEKKEEPKK